MFWRSLNFIGFLLAGGVAGYYAELELNVVHGLLLGVLAATLLWFAIDVTSASRLMKSCIRAA